MQIAELEMDVAADIVQVVGYDMDLALDLALDPIKREEAIAAHKKAVRRAKRNRPALDAHTA